ncbi:hypothetical protein LguiB_001350 [Lonicera macranthoides]
MLKQLLQTDGEGLAKFPMPQEFSLTSKLDPKVYGNQNSSITKNHIKNNLDGLTIEEIQQRYQDATSYLPFVFEGSSLGVGKFGYLRIRRRQLSLSPK